MSLHRIPVMLGDRSYDVVVGSGAIGELPAALPEHVRRVLVVSQRAIPLDVVPLLSISGRTVHKLDIEVGEAAKSIDTVMTIVDVLGDIGATRNDVIVAVGGGLVTDVAGFAASIWHRGIGVIHVATTLLAMVDAAIGGKTGVNTRHGKNLVGAFWQPRAVICDTDVLASLPASEIRGGRGEMAKYHFLTGDDLLTMGTDDLVARCVQIKAALVASDEREGGRRALLNYGHTLGHAIERQTNFAVPHGEAVAIGLVFAARLAHRLGRIDQARVAYHEQVVREHYGLSIELPVGISVDGLMSLMLGDKKALAGLTFVLDGPVGCEVVSGVDERVVREVLADSAVR
jgi:5-deoxy-5-amino-3-dehydroquinate synthase